jgi:hypothetical protein
VVSVLEADSKKETGLFDAKPVAVMDAGIATEENLAFLRSVNFDYICVSRGGLQDYTLAQPGSKTVFDISTSLNNHNRNHPIEINMATPEAKENGDLYLYVKSAMKQQKKESMNNKLTKRFVSELEHIKSSLSKRRGVKEEGAVNQRIGRLKQKYPSIGKQYHIELRTDEKKTGEKRTVVDITYEQSKPASQAGVYFIRCSQNQLTEELIWEIYNILHEMKALSAV